MSEYSENMNRIIIMLTEELLVSMKDVVGNRPPCIEPCDSTCGPEERARCGVRLLRIGRTLNDLIQMNKPAPPAEIKPEPEKRRCSDCDSWQPLRECKSSVKDNSPGPPPSGPSPTENVLINERGWTPNLSDEERAVFAIGYKAGDTCPKCKNGTVERIPGTKEMKLVLQCSYCRYLFPEKEGD